MCLRIEYLCFFSRERTETYTNARFERSPKSVSSRSLTTSFMALPGQVPPSGKWRLASRTLSRTSSSFPFSGYTIGMTTSLVWSPRQEKAKMETRIPRSGLFSLYTQPPAVFKAAAKMRSIANRSMRSQHVALPLMRPRRFPLEMTTSAQISG